MATITEAALDPAERRTLHRLIELLAEEYGPELLGVWLYGSRARGERTGPYSDIDLMVITTEGEKHRGRSTELLHRAAEEAEGEPWLFSVHPYDPERLARDRAIESFFIAEVDRDKIVLFGDEETSIDAGGEPESRDHLDEHMKRRSEDFMAVARGKLDLARLALSAGLFSEAVDPIYYTSLNAARAALSEEHGYARTHSGAWHLFHQTFVVTGRFDAATFKAARDTQRPRGASTYNAVVFGRSDVERMLIDAERFLAAVEAMFE